MGKYLGHVDKLRMMKGTLIVFILQGLSLLVVGKNYVSESAFPTKDFYIKSDMIAKSLSSECCDGITGIDIHLSGDPAGYQFGLIGHYNLQGDLVNGRHYWVKDNGYYGIWYTNINVNAWIVGSIGNLGSSTGGLASAALKNVAIVVRNGNIPIPSVH